MNDTPSFVVDVHCAKVLPRLPSCNPTQVAFRKIFLPLRERIFQKERLQEGWPRPFGCSIIISHKRGTSCKDAQGRRSAS